LVKYKQLFSRFQGHLIFRKWNKADLTHKYIIKYFRTTRSQSHFVVDISAAEVEGFLRLDLQFVEPKVFAVDKGANFSALSLMPNISLNYAIAGNMDEIPGAEEESVKSDSRKSLTYYLLIQDTLYILAYGISKLLEVNGRIEAPSGISCRSGEIWPYGHQLISLMKSVKENEVTGFTGGIEFGQDGNRKNVNISILELNKDGYVEYGYWNAKEKLVVTKEFSETKEEIQKEIKGKTLRVATIELNTPTGSSHGGLIS
uniref:ANF_receptor domain-containing protein n=1 Tax=Rodentolepis nana TaxID=102285 RepID=A0A0R3T8M8_RODNA